jgi:hypothetical protein
VSIGTEDASAQPDAHGFVAFADLYASRVCKAPEEADEYEFEIETAAAPLAGAPCASDQRAADCRRLAPRLWVGHEIRTWRGRHLGRCLDRTARSERGRRRVVRGCELGQTVGAFWYDSSAYWQYLDLALRHFKSEPVRLVGLPEHSFDACVCSARRSRQSLIYASEHWPLDDAACESRRQLERR